MSRTYRKYDCHCYNFDSNVYTLRWKKRSNYRDKMRKKFFLDSISGEIEIPTSEFPLKATFGKSFLDGFFSLNKKWHKQFHNRKFRHYVKQRIHSGDYEFRVLKKTILWDIL